MCECPVVVSCVICFLLAGASEAFVLKHNPSWSSAGVEGPAFRSRGGRARQDVLSRECPDPVHARDLARTLQGLSREEVEAFDRDLARAIREIMSSDTFTVLYQMVSHVLVSKVEITNLIER